MKGGSRFSRYTFYFLCLTLPSILVAQPDNDSIAGMGRKLSGWLDLFRPQTIKSSEKEALEAIGKNASQALKTSRD